MAQLTFSDVEMGMGRKRETRRSRFLDRLSKSCPWDAWLALVREARGADAGAQGRRRPGRRGRTLGEHLGL